MSGGYDLMVVVDGDRLHEVAAFVSEKLSTMKGVLSTATHFRLRAYKENNVELKKDSGPQRLAVALIFIHDSRKTNRRTCRDIPRSGIRDFFEIVQTMQDVNLAGHWRARFSYSVEDSRSRDLRPRTRAHGLTSNLGLPRLRERIAGYVQQHFQPATIRRRRSSSRLGVSEAHLNLALAPS